jgi:hypothetical protein
LLTEGRGVKEGGKGVNSTAMRYCIAVTTHNNLFMPERALFRGRVLESTDFLEDDDEERATQ